MLSDDGGEDPSKSVDEQAEDLVQHAAKRSGFPSTGVSGDLDRPVLHGDVPEAGVAHGVHLVAGLDGDEVPAVADAQVRQAALVEEVLGGACVGSLCGKFRQAV